ncbi:uncharacterized protein [Symphalangus syndactylus]|uniref:uncharacterized protein isoform X5 n=1 Tax=Symphalangus syndactylus TaxID=9590 RepID=UPI0030045642
MNKGGGRRRCSQRSNGASACRSWYTMKQRLAMLLELGLELLSSSIPRCLILQSAEITGVNHHAWRKTRREKSKPNRRESFKKEVVANTKISYDIQEEKKGNTITTFNKDQGQLPLARAQPRATPG